MDAPVATSRVTAVTVYRAGALVTREVDLSALSLPTDLSVPGLPLTLDDGSLRTEVVAGEGPAPVATDVRVTVAVPPADPDLAPPDDEALRQAERELAIASQRVDELHASVDRLRTMGPGARGRPEKGKPPAVSPTAARRDLLQFRTARIEACIRRLRVAERVQYEANERVATLRERKRVASSARNARVHEVRKAAIVRLTGEGMGPGARLRLHYFVPGARWAPAYCIRLHSDMTSASLELRAAVGQATGEDWRGAALTLSTATPLRWTELPELRAQKIGRAQPAPRKTGWRPPPLGTDALYDDYDRDVPEPPPPPPPPQPTPAPALASHGDERLMTRTGMAPPAPPPMAPPSPTAASQTVTFDLEQALADMPTAPPAGAAPAGMPMRSMPQMEARKRGGLGGLIGSAVNAFGGGGEPQGHAAPAEEHSLDAFGPASVVAGRDLLDYAALRLAEPDEAGRGTLHRASPQVQYLQSTTLSASEMTLAMTRIQAALRGARSLERSEAPARHHWPAPEPGFDYAYVADGPIDVPSDGETHAIALRVEPATARPRYVSVPRETQDVFRIVALHNPLAAPLLAGPADVYLGGKYVLTTDVETTAIGGKLELGLGVEPRIKISRNVEFAEDTSGIIKRQHDLEHRIAIEVVNHLAVPAQVEVRERIPVAAPHQRDDIAVSVEDVIPAWDEYEDDDETLEGGRHWEVEVAPGGTQTLSAKWIVSIPSQHELVGGNRRET